MVGPMALNHGILVRIQASEHTDPTHNDFYFGYYNPENKRIACYFPE